MPYTMKPELLATNYSQNMLVKSLLTLKLKPHVYKLLLIPKILKLMLKTN